MTTPKSGPRWQRKKDVRPQEILDAALELFVQQGFAATKVSQIARKAGVTPGTLYVYYKNKEAILQEVVMKTINPIYETSNAILENYDGPAEKLFSMLFQKWFEAVGGESKISGVPKLVVSEVANFPELADFYMKNILTPGANYIRRVLQYGVEKGTFHIEDMDMMVYLILSTLHGAVIDVHSFNVAGNLHIDMHAFEEKLHALILHGILKTN